MRYLVVGFYSAILIVRKLLAIALLAQMAWADPTQKALTDLSNPSLEKRLQANAVLEELDPRKLPPKLVSTCITALSQAAQKEKNRFRPGDYARCLMRYTAASSSPEKDLPSILPLLTHSSSEVVQYSWTGVAQWARRPLKQPVVDKLLALLDHPREQVRINALMWLCRHAQIKGTPLSALQRQAWQRVTAASQQSDSIRLRTAGIRFLLEYSTLDEPRVLTILSTYLTQPKWDEEDYLTYDQLDRWLEERGLEAAVLNPPLEQAGPLFRERKLSALHLRWRAMLGPWTVSEKAAVEKFVQETPLLHSLPKLAEALSEHGSEAQPALVILVGRLAKAPDFQDDPLLYSALARSGVDSAATNDCLKYFALKPDAEHSGLLAAIGSSGSKDPLVQEQLRTYLTHSDESVQWAAAYALACLGAPPEPVKEWLRGKDLSNCDGLTIGLFRRLKLKPELPADFQVTTGETVILKRMAGQSDPVWNEFIELLGQPRYPFRCWRCRSLAQKEATLACLELIQADLPKLKEEPLAVKLLTTSPDPEVAQAALTLWGVIRH